MKCTLDSIDSQFVHQLNETLKGYPGKCALSLSVIDPESRVEVQMVSRTYRVDASNELFNNLKLLEGVEFSLN